VDAKRLADFQRTYRALSDSRIAELHAEGPAAFATPEIWAVLDEEFRRRGAQVRWAEESVVATWKEEVAVAEVEARVAARRATMGERLASLFVDLGVLSSIGILLGWAMGDWGVVAAVLLAAVYHPAAELCCRRTLGKAVFGLRVVNLDGSRPRPFAILWRAFLRIGVFHPVSLWSLAHGVWPQDGGSRTLVVRDTSTGEPGP
jgi:hypothetical protein